jgi:hypothetical protein
MTQGVISRAFMNCIKAHFQRYRERKPWDFCWRIAIEGTIVSIGAGFLLSLCGLADREINIAFPVLLITGLVGAPVFETLLLQALPVWVARKCKARFSIQVAASVVFFFAPHAIEGIGTAIVAGLLGGFYFAFTYAHWREFNRWTAFWVTAVSHTIHNGIIIPLAFAFGEI